MKVSVAISPPASVTVSVIVLIPTDRALTVTVRLAPVPPMTIPAFATTAVFDEVAITVSDAGAVSVSPTVNATGPMTTLKLPSWFVTSEIVGGVFGGVTSSLVMAMFWLVVAPRAMFADGFAIVSVAVSTGSTSVSLTTANAADPVVWPLKIVMVMFDKEKSPAVIPAPVTLIVTVASPITAELVVAVTVMAVDPASVPAFALTDRLTVGISSLVMAMF